MSCTGKPTVSGLGNDAVNACAAVVVGLQRMGGSGGALENRVR